VSDPGDGLKPVTPGSERPPWGALVTLSAGVSLIIIDATIVNVALPTIIGRLGLTLTQAEWVNSTYALVFASLLILFGRLGDALGRKRVFLAGIVVFVGASLLAAAAPSGDLLILARVVQGVGGAAVLPTSLALVNATFLGAARPIAFGVWGATIGGMAALGPLAGGALTEFAGWRWIFLVNLPLGVIIVVLARRLVPESKDPAPVRSWDVPGVVTLSLGLFLFVFGLIEGQTYGWLRPDQPFSVAGWDWPLASVSPIAFAFAFSALFLVVFLAIERRAVQPLVDLGLFRLRSFSAGNVAALIVALGEFGLVFAIPLYLQSVLGLSALEAGAALAVTAVGALLAGGAAAAFSKRIGPRAVARFGLGFEAVGLVLYAVLVGADISAWRLVPALFLYGFGVGLATAQLTSVILADVPTERSGQGSGIQSTSRQVGSALGIAILGATLAAGLTSHTESGLKAAGLPPAQAAGIASAVSDSGGTAIPSLSQQLLAPAAEALRTAGADATRTTALVAAGFILVGLVATFLLPHQRHEDL
jgi:EmrB/QacA subfamily drug resistance transporter